MPCPHDTAFKCGVLPQQHSLGRGYFERGTVKEGVLLRNVSPSLVLCDHFPGGGKLELQTGSSWEWPFIVCLFWE